MSTAAAALMEPGFDMNRLSYEIFSILESKFLFGYDDPKMSLTGSSPAPGTPTAGRVRVLSIDGGDGLIAGAAVARLEALLRKQSGDPSAQIADFFDVAAGSGAGGILAAMLFTKGADGRPLFTADEALRYLAKNQGKLSSAPKKGLFCGIIQRSGSRRFRRVFAGATMRDTLKPVLIPCYDLSTGAPFLFSRADAVEAESYDFLMRDVCAATCAAGAMEMRSVDGRTRILAAGGALAMRNPTAAAITHVLNNKQEFPFAAGVEDLLVLSLGDGEVGARSRGPAPPSTAEIVRIAGERVTDMVDQAVAMAFGFGHNRTSSSSYVRIQANGFGLGRKPEGGAEAVLGERNVESVLFRGSKISEESNGEKLEWLSAALVKEQERRRKSSIPTVIIKQVMTTTTSTSP